MKMMDWNRLIFYSLFYCGAFMSMEGYLVLKVSSIFLKDSISNQVNSLVSFPEAKASLVCAINNSNSLIMVFNFLKLILSFDKLKLFLELCSCLLYIWFWWCELLFRKLNAEDIVLATTWIIFYYQTFFLSNSNEYGWLLTISFD